MNNTPTQFDDDDVIVAPPDDAPPYCSEEAGWRYAAMLCDEWAQHGNSILILGKCGVGKSTVEEMMVNWSDNVVSWNSTAATLPPPTDKVLYLLLEEIPPGVSLHRRLPDHGGPGFMQCVRDFINPKWIR